MNIKKFGEIVEFGELFKQLFDKVAPKILIWKLQIWQDQKHLK